MFKLTTIFSDLKETGSLNLQSHYNENLGSKYFNKYVTLSLQDQLKIKLYYFFIV